MTLSKSILFLFRLFAFIKRKAMRTVFTIAFMLVFPFLQLNAHPAWGIVVDKHRNIYFADIIHNGRGSVWKLDNQGKLHLLLRDFHAHNVSLDENGRVVTAHGENNHTMVKLGADGHLDTLYHTLDYQEFFGGNCTYSPKRGIVFGAAKYVWTIGRDGERHKASEYKFGWNQTVYVDEEGNIYAPDIAVDNGSLVKIYPDGHAETIATDLYPKLDRPIDQHQDVLLGITKGCDNDIYTAETAGQRIIRIKEDGQTEIFYKSSGDWFPTGIDFFAGDAYILENKFGKQGLEGPRITMISESGNQTELFNYDTYAFGKAEKPEPSQKKNSLWLIVFIIAGVIGSMTLLNYLFSRGRKKYLN